MNKVLVYIKKEWLMITGLILGAVGGYLYWRFIGCSSGSCPITSSPLMSTIWGSIMGGLLSSAFKKEKK